MKKYEIERDGYYNTILEIEEEYLHMELNEYIDMLLSDGIISKEAIINDLLDRIYLWDVSDLYLNLIKDGIIDFKTSQEPYNETSEQLYIMLDLIVKEV